MYTWGIFVAYIRRRLSPRLRCHVFWEAGVTVCTWNDLLRPSWSELKPTTFFEKSIDKLHPSKQLNARSLPQNRWGSCGCGQQDSSCFWTSDEKWEFQSKPSLKHIYGINMKILPHSIITWVFAKQENTRANSTLFKVFLAFSTEHGGNVCHKRFLVITSWP